MTTLQRKLETLEKKYGGLTQNVKRTIKSPKESNYYTLHQGGDRMKSIYHNYSAQYSKYIKPYLDKDIILVEVGILTGIGLAIWCELFTNAKIYGLDIDIKIFTDNFENLCSKGAFVSNKPVIHTFDQYMDNTNYIKKITNDQKVTIVIDDGCHKTDAILKTLDSFLPHLADNFVYFIEDNRQVHKIIRKKYNTLFVVDYHDQMTILTPKRS